MSRSDARTNPSGTFLSRKKHHPSTLDSIPGSDVDHPIHAPSELGNQGPVALVVQDELSKARQKNKPPKTKPRPKATPTEIPASQNPSGTDDELGRLSRRYEAKGPGTVSTGKGDKGGVSYGSYQFASANGSAAEFVRSLKKTHFSYYVALAGARPGTPAFSAAWRKLATKDPIGFDRAQHEYIKKKFYDVAAACIKRLVGMDLDLRSATLRDVVWSTAVQSGPCAGPKAYARGIRGAADIVKIALKGQDPATVSDEELIKAIYAERGRKNTNGTLVYFSGSSKQVQQGVSNRYKDEMKNALSHLMNEQPTAVSPSKGPQKSLVELPADVDSKTPKTVASTPAYDVTVARKLDVWIETSFISKYSVWSDGGLETPSSSAAGRMASKLHVYARPLKERIQVATGSDGQGGIVVDAKAATQCLEYIDEQLALGRPVVAGVSHSAAHVDNLTLSDLYVLINGKGVSAKGRTFYVFQNPAARKPVMGAYTNPDNTFYVEPGTGKLYRPAPVSTGDDFGRRYEVAMVVRNF